MNTMLLSRLLLQSNYRKRRPVAVFTLLAAVMLLAVEPLSAQQYWNTNGTTAAINAANWGTSGAGPFTNAYVANTNMVFSANSLISYVTANPSIGNITVTAGNTTWTAAGTLSTTGNVRTVDIAAGSVFNWGNQNVSFVAGTGFIKNGLGTWHMNTITNGYLGGFTINAGLVTFSGNNTLGGASSTLNLNGGTIANLNASARAMVPGTINIGGNFQIGDAVNVPAGTGTISFAGTVGLGAATRTINIGGTGTYTFSGVISGSGTAGLSVTASSTGKIVLSGVNTYPGATSISTGRVEMGVANALPSTTAVTMGNASSAILNLVTYNQTVGSIAGGGTTGGNITLGTGNLTAGGDNTSTTYGAVISGSGAFTKAGTGTLTLTGTNTYTGVTTINAGSLLINSGGSLATGSNITASPGSILGGDGTVNGPTALSGTVAPGSAPNVSGTFNTANFTFGSGSAYNFDITNVTGTAGAASGWDFINANGAINTSFSPVTINLKGIGANGFNTNNSYTWIIATGTSISGFNPANFTVVNASGSSMTIPVGATLTVEQSGNSLQVVYTPPSGNTITLSPATQLPGGSYCNGVSNNVITLTYVTSGTVTAPAIELSDPSGSFLSGTVQLAGTVTGSGPYTITGTIPGGQTASTTYRVRIISSDAIPVISGNNGNNITITAAVTPSVTIAITTGANPACAGDNITFTATPVNAAAPAYQWKKNGSNVGTNSATYTTNTLVDGDVITCVITPSVTCVTLATATSNSITMTVNAIPATPANPVASGVNPSCGNNSLNTMAPDPNTTFYWQGTVSNGTSTANSTSSSYTVSSSGTYYVNALSNAGCWSAGSGSIALTINTAPSISVQPANKNISAGGNTSYSVTAANAVGYQWQVDQGSGFSNVTNGGVYAGATTSTLTLTGVPLSYNNYVYQCIVTGGACADLVSGPASLSVNPVPWEDFETGTKAAYTIGNVTCTAGSWSFNNALIGTDITNDFLIGNQSARININGDITMNFNLTSLGVVKLSHRTYGTDANSTWQLQASTDNGVTWTAYTSAIYTATGTAQTQTILVNIVGNIRFRILNLETSGSHRINIDDIYVTTYTGCATPTGQAVYFNASPVLTTSMTLNFAAGTGGSGRIVVVKQGSAVSGFPTSGVSYIPGSSDFSTGLPTIGTGEKVVYNGTGSSVTVTGLTPNTTYYIQVFEYAGTNCYLVSNVSNTGVATTACNTPSTNASAVNASAVTTTTATLTWVNGNGTNRLVVVNPGSAVSGSPVNGSSYSANSSYTVAPSFTPGTGKIVYNSTTNTVALTNLSSNTVYYVSVFEYNSATNCYVATGATTTFTTGSLLSDIISAGGENSCISSMSNGVITSSTDGSQAWQFTVRDGGSSAPDADNLPTIVNSIVITQGTSNTVTDWTNIQAAALFDGTTKIANGAITATTITFTGTPLTTVADNSTKTLTLRITLKNTVTIPTTIDGKIFRFSISQGNITLAASGTSGKNTSALVATTDVTKDVVCVVATRLVYSVQPSNAGQNQGMTPNVVVTALDLNGNLDLDFTSVVSITSTAGAGLNGTPITATAIAGTATFTGIKHTTLGTYTMTASAGGVSSVGSTNYTISPVTTFAPGDFAILAVNNNNTNAVDEIAFVVFKDILTGTSFYMTDNGYERVNAGQWGTSEGIVRLTYTGAATIPAGTIFVIQGSNTSFTMLKCGANDNANWSINPNVLTSGTFNINNSDQVWFTQGGAWTSASGSLTGHDAVTTGNVLYGWTGIDWKSNIGNTSPTWTTQGSRMFPKMGCFSTNLLQTTDLGRTKYTGPTTATTRLGWIARINNISNWTTYASNALYDAATPNYAGGGAPCTVTISASVPVDGKWTGEKNTDWFDCNNWDTREVPNATISVNIPSTATNACVVDNVTYASNAIQYGNTADCFDLTVDNKSLSTGNAADVINVNGNFILSNGASLNMTGGGTFNLQTGSWTKTASTFTGGTGTVSFNSAASQNIPAEDFNNLTSTNTGGRVLPNGSTVGITGTFTPGTNTYTITGSTVDFKGPGAQNIPAFSFNNLSVSNSGTKTLTGDVDVQTDFTLNNSAVFSLGNNYLSLKSTATQTARVAPVSASASISYPGTGRFVVERYFPARRAWRLITAPVTADAANSLFNSWQVGGATPTGLGTYISGPGETTANGLDITPQHNYSLKTFNQLTSGFDGVGDTKANRIAGITGTAGVPDNIGYFMFVRGDRTPANINAFNQWGLVNETTLKDTGKIQIKTYTFPANPSVGTNRYTLIGNPYASPVDFANVTKTNVANKFQAWDPKLNTVGGYVVVDLSAGPAVIVPVGSTQTQVIQSSQAVLVETTNASSPSVSFGEAAKSAVDNLTLFRPGNTPASIAINLHTVDSDGTSTLADGALVQYDNKFSADADQYDALKFTNINETFSVVDRNRAYMLERRPVLNAGDTLFLAFKRSRQQPYRLNFIASQLADRNLTGYLVDQYKKTSTAISMEGSTWFDFEVNADAASAAADRFYVVFKKAVRFNYIHANMLYSDVLVSWLAENEADMAGYELERSLDGTSFTGISNVPAKEGLPEGSGYSAIDLDPTPGVYYYRVKGTSVSGAYGYSEVVKIKVVRTKGQLYVYPNPVTDGNINIQMSLLPEGKYQVRLLGTGGQVLLSNRINHTAHAVTETIACPATVRPGTYQLEITGENKLKSVVSVVIAR